MENLTASHPAYTITYPKTLMSSVVVASPHSGRQYDSDFLNDTILDDHAIRSSEDAYVDLLIDYVPDLGAPLLTASAPRAFLDLNRSQQELDPALIKGVRRQSQNPRIASGLGIIPRVVANGRSIYRGKLPRAEANRRISLYWEPYHAALKNLLDRAHGEFGRSILLDMHSMPHEAAMQSGTLRPIPQIVIGDRFGASADKIIVDKIEALFVAQGFRVARNAPFAGAFMTQNYGRPYLGHHVVQIEIDRSLYLNEEAISLSKEYEAVKQRLKAVLSELIAFGSEERAMAAE